MRFHQHFPGNECETGACNLLVRSDDACWPAFPCMLQDTKEHLSFEAHGMEFHPVSDFGSIDRYPLQHESLSWPCSQVANYNAH